MIVQLIFEYCFCIALKTNSSDKKCTEKPLIWDQDELSRLSGSRAMRSSFVSVVNNHTVFYINFSKNFNLSFLFFVICNHKKRVDRLLRRIRYFIFSFYLIRFSYASRTRLFLYNSRTGGKDSGQWIWILGFVSLQNYCVDSFTKMTALRIWKSS